MTCPICGLDNSADKSSCVRCGTTLSAPAGPQPSEAAPPPPQVDGDRGMTRQAPYGQQAPYGVQPPVDQQAPYGLRQAPPSQHSQYNQRPPEAGQRPTHPDQAAPPSPYTQPRYDQQPGFGPAGYQRQPEPGWQGQQPYQQQQYGQQQDWPQYGYGQQQRYPAQSHYGPADSYDGQQRSYDQAQAYDRAQAYGQARPQPYGGYDRQDWSNVQASKSRRGMLLGIGGGVVAVAIVVVVVLLLTVFRTPVFDNQQMALDIQNSAQGKSLGTVTCPKGQEVKKGRKFDCHAGKVTIHIVVTSDSGDYTWTPVQSGR